MHAYPSFLRRSFGLAALFLTSTLLSRALSPAPVRPADGVRTIYAIFIANAPYFQWKDARDMFLFLRDTHHADPANLYVLLTGTGIPSDHPEIVDGRATATNLEAAFNAIAAKMDADDLFFFQIESEGQGYLGRASGSPANAAYHGYVGVTPRISQSPTDERDLLESDFELSILCANGLLDGRDYHYGLNQWGVRWYPGTGGYLSRVKVMSHFTDVYVEGRGFLSDNDVYLERFTDYALGDLNRNGIVDPGENFDYDGDGVPAYDPATGAFDEDDWGPIDVFEDNVMWWHSSLVGIPFTIFDANLDDHLDIDVNPGATLQVDGTDLNNDGCIDGLDLDGDGQLTSWVAFDETVYIADAAITDDQVRSYMDVLTNGTKVVVTSTCFGGGLIRDLSRANTIVISGSRELCQAAQGFVHELFRAAFTTYAEEADVDGNGLVSFAEAFNFARLHPWMGCAEGMDRFLYDDNADGVGTDGLVTGAGDGALGAVTYWEGVPPHVISLATTLAVISPNRDGVKDTTTFSAAFTAPGGTWTLTLRNAASTVVRTASGTGATMSYVWDGNDSTGVAVADGSYTAEIAVTAYGLTDGANTLVTVDKTKPVVTNLRDSRDPFRPANGETTVISFTLSETGTLDVGLYNSKNVRVRTLYNGATSQLNQALTWNGRNDAGALVSNGTYTYKVQMTDIAGNASLVYSGTSQKK
jgi:flagellar hook assembly protein FlgD